MSCGHALPEPSQCAEQTKHDPSLSLGTEHAMHERTTHPSTGMDRKTRIMPDNARFLVALLCRARCFGLDQEPNATCGY